METKNIILVEGASDLVFLEIFMKYKNINDYEVVINRDDENDKDKGGKNLRLDKINLLQMIVDDGKRACIIFDADTSHSQTLKRLKQELGKELQDEVKIFLFPNNKDNGEKDENDEIETLLDIIAKERDIVNCFNEYLKCIKDKCKCENFAKNIHKKSKMYAYYEAVGLQKKYK